MRRWLWWMILGAYPLAIVTCSTIGTVGGDGSGGATEATGGATGSG